MKKLCAILLAACLLLGVCGAAAAEEKSYVVGICQLAPHPALDAANEGFRDALVDLLGDKVTFFEQNAAGEAANCNQIMVTLLNENVDLILGIGTGALQAGYAATGDIPILGTAITDYGAALDIEMQDGKTGVNVSGTSDLAPLDQQAEMLHAFYPDAKKVGLIYCSSEANSAFQINVIRQELEKLGYECTEYTFSDSSDVSSVTQAACAGSDVLYIPTDNTAASCTEAIRNVVEVEKKAVIAGEEGICAGCGIATLSISYYELGEQTGRMAYEILVNGANPAEMAIQYAPTTTKKYNAQLCDILGVEVPEGYEVIEGTELAAAQ